MKAILLMMMLAGTVLAGTNEFTGMSVTNKLGDVFTGLTLEKATTEGLMFSCKAGLVKTKWEQLPAWCKESYGAAGMKQDNKDRYNATLSARVVEQRDAYDAKKRQLAEEDSRLVDAKMRQIEKDRHDAEIAAKEAARKQRIADEDERNRKDREAIATRDANAPQRFISGGPAKRK